MNNDLKIIKKYYGEKMMHLCRELFSTILDNHPGTLSKILLDNYAPSHYLYDDLILGNLYDSCNYVTEFKNYIYSKYDEFFNTKSEVSKEIPDPITLMREAGYTLYECLTEQDIQRFRKYYLPKEELCTFNGGRLKHCYVYFAVHDDADKLKRNDFHNPRRQDKYGTSVLSIQFTRDKHHTLSIKNRYNHTVANPDATFSNDLDNIIPGLTDSFAAYYGMGQEHGNSQFELLGYVRANDGKYYKYNYEIDNIYYCPNNIIIDNFQVTNYPKEKYLILDYFILDLVNKTIINKVPDSLSETIGEIKKINITNNHQGKTVKITPIIGEDITIELDKYNHILSYQDNNSKRVNDNFLSNISNINKLTMNNVTSIGNSFLAINTTLTEINLPNVEFIKDDFLKTALEIKQVSFPKLKFVGNNFMEWSLDLEHVRLPRLLKIGYAFLRCNNSLEAIFLPKVRRIADMFLMDNINLKTIYLPEVLSIGDNFCPATQKVSKLNLSKVKTIGSHFMVRNRVLTEIYLPEVETVGHNFMSRNDSLVRAIFPKLTSIGMYFLNRTKNNITEFFAPNLSTDDYDNDFENNKEIYKRLMKVANINKNDL